MVIVLRNYESNNKMRELWYKIKRICLKLRLQPIRVYCMHHVCDKFDAESMNKGDWMQIDEFKNKVIFLN